MKNEDVLLAAWERTLARYKHKPAILNPRGEVVLGFGDLELLSRQLQHDVLSHFEPGEILAIQIGNHSHWPALFLACIRRGTVVLPLERTMSEQERASVLNTCHVAGLMTRPDEPAQRFDAGPVDWQGYSPVLLKLTSGTTANPRAVRFRSEQLLADAVQICDTMGITESDLNFAVIPISHSYGFSNLLTPLLVRGVPSALSSDRLPRAILDGLKRTGATVFPGMPLFFQSLGQMCDVPPLPKLRLCISAGAPLPRQVALKFREKFGLPIHSFYGASECGGICYDREALDFSPEGFAGPAMEGVDVSPIEHDATANHHARHNYGGQIRVQSAAVGDGYFPELDPAKLGNGCFIPDDLVSLGKDGLRLIGRISDVINVAGKKVNPAEVEACLLSYGAVQEAVVFGRSSSLRHEEVIACVVTTKEDATEGSLLEYCRKRLSGWQVPRRIFLLPSLPRNERGKISRRLLAEKFATSSD